MKRHTIIRVAHILFALVCALASQGCEERGAPQNSGTGTGTGGTTGTGTTGGAATSGTGGTTKESTSTVKPPPAADNTARNERDADSGTLTPEDQGGSEADRRITAEIRKALVGQSSLSVNAQNCKVITRDGVVTLRGPVASEAEKNSVGDIARSVAGVSQVVNELEIKT